MTPDDPIGQAQPPRRGPGRPSNAQKAAMQAASSNAINHPVNTGNNVDLESGDYVPEFDDVVDYSQLKFTLVAPQIKVVGDREFKAVAEQEAFMQHKLVISINKNNDKNTPPMVAVGLNGDICWLPRGRKIRVPRGLVGCLAQSHERTFTTPREENPNADQGFKIEQESAPTYPFNVLYDPDPQRGARWLRRVSAEGC